jgi:glycosyltransferase involved in cell wall biosynthesis
MPMNAPTPLVSCVMPTADRRHFVPQAIRYFLAQDYPARELVILDDGAESCADLVPCDALIRYEHLDGVRTLGAKRNACVEASRGDLILHWDDDDWMAPDRITRQVTALLAADADACGLEEMLFFAPHSGQTWLFSYARQNRARMRWLAGGSLLYTRAFWRRAPFPNIQVASDTRFIFSRRLDRAVALPDYRFYVALIHPRNTSPKRLRGHYWSRWDGDLRDVMGADLAFYEQLAGPSRAAADPPPPPASETRPDRSVITLATPGEPEPDGQPGDEASLTPNTVAVSIPYYRCQAHIRCAVESILAQTHTDLRLVVINDGDDQQPPWPVLEDLDDPRLVRFDLEQNHGRYFADAVVLYALDAPYFLVQDADDWSAPERIARLLSALRQAHADVTMSACWHHRLTGGRVHKTGMESIRERLAHPLDRQFTHRAWHYALFRTAALQAVGGNYGGFRIGYDTLLMNFMLMAGPTTYVEYPLYNRLIRPDSLVNAPATGLRSPYRQQITGQLRALYADAFAAYTQYLGGSLTRASLLDTLHALSQRHISAADRDALRHEIERLRAAIATGSQARAPVRAPSARPVAITPVREHTITLKGLLKHPSVPWDGWAIGKIAAAELAERLETRRPAHLLEIGSGTSTAFLARYAQAHDATLISLEHDPAYHAQTGALLAALGLRDAVDLRHAPLREHTFGTNGQFPWYDSTLTGPFDFVFVDGPPERFGRQAILFALAGLLADDWELWLHDAQRPHEQTCLDLWRAHFDFATSLHAFDEKSMAVLRPHPDEATPPQETFWPTLGITLLTNRRLNLFKQTIETLAHQVPGLLEAAYVIALVNGPDPATRGYVEALPFVDRRLFHAQNILSVGRATSLLMREVLRHRSLKTVLHLEDDWCFATLDHTWLARAHAILDAEPEVGQVRLRHMAEPVLDYHMITRQPIAWQPRDGYRIARAAHFTFNPHLIRTRDVPRIYPSRDERDAQRRFLDTRLATAQLTPGVFRHTGAQQSLRRTLRRRS